MKKILFVHPDMRGGGAEKVLVNLLNGLDKEKYDITLFTFFHEGVNRKSLSPAIHQKWLFKSVFRGYSVLQKLFSPGLLFRLFVKEKYDIIVAYLEGVPTRIVGGCNSESTALISWLHIKIDETGIEKVFWGKSEMERIYKRFTQVVCVSETARKSIVSYVHLPTEKAMVIHNSIDVQAILDASCVSADGVPFPKNQLNLVTVGRLMPQKGYDRLLRIVARLKSEVSGFHLYILGDGELRNEFTNFIVTNGLGDVVTLLGFQSNPYPYVKASDLFVCSSYNEGYSTAVSEAMLLEVPVVTTRCSGMDEILADGEFGLITENEEEALFQGLKSLLENKTLLKSYKEKAITRSGFFRANNNVQRVEELFDRL